MIQGHLPELFIRLKVYDYVERFLEVAKEYESDLLATESLITYRSYIDPEDTGGIYTLASERFRHIWSDSVKREYNGMRNLIEGWRQTENYQLYQRVCVPYFS